MKLFHQAGHNSIWNIESFSEDNAGDGIIFSPVNIKRERLVDSSLLNLRKNSLFDPQFYAIPKNHKNYTQYDFHPSNFLQNNQSTTLESHWNHIIESCINFQLESDFNSLIIPVRFYTQIPSNYYENLRSHYIDRFLDCYRQFRTEKEIFITLIVKQIEITDDEKREELLSWITSIPDIKGVYLIFENTFQTKQIKNSDFLFNALVFIYYLSINQLKVVVGYSNLEGIIYSVAYPYAVSMGAYENVRIFNDTKRFISTESKDQKGPNARIYSGKLLQYIDHGYLGSFKRAYGDIEEIFENSKYQPVMFEPTFKWHFTKPELYKHFFKIYSDQIHELPETIELRIQHVKELLQDSINKFEEIRNRKGILLNTENDGSHLYFFLTALNQYEKFITNENR